jgi:hypothetical protein
MAMTWRVRGAAWSIIILFNLFLVSFAVLRSHQKGKAWQTLFLYQWLQQCAMEVFLCVTMECVWLNMMMPA